MILSWIKLLDKTLKYSASCSCRPKLVFNTYACTLCSLAMKTGSKEPRDTNWYSNENHISGQVIHNYTKEKLISV
jgi:hypothetical protein